LEVELVANRLFLSALISIKRVLSEFLLDSDVNLVEQALVCSLLIIPDLFLITSLITVLSNNMTVKLEVEYHVLHNVISLKVAILI